MSTYAEWLREGAEELAATPSIPDAAWTAYNTAMEAANAADDPFCEYCGVVVGGSRFAPYCSRECRDDAATEDAIAAGTEPEPA